MLGSGKMKEDMLLIVRTVFLIVAFAHLVLTAIYTLSIDTTVDEDPTVKAYYYIKWLLLTCWFNSTAKGRSMLDYIEMTEMVHTNVTLGYLPTRLYCDWKTLQGHGDSDLVKKCNRITDVVMTGLLAPTTVFSDLAFWYIYKYHPSMMAPVQLFKYMPEWAQHSLHTVSLLVILGDLMLTPRTRPRSVKPHLILMNTFLLVYFYALYISLENGIAVYPLLEHVSATVKVLAIMFTLIFHWIVFKLEWVLIEARWGKLKATREKLN